MQMGGQMGRPSLQMPMQALPTTDKKGKKSKKQKKAKLSPYEK